jgi:hypothetical protein
MTERTEYWWISYEAGVHPAQVAFTGGIPTRIWMIGSAESIPATAISLIERLPMPPEPILAPPVSQPATPKQKRSGSLLWFLGILLLIFVAQCSGSIFDAIK